MTATRHGELFQRMPVPRFIVEARGGEEYVVAEINDLALRYFDLSAEQIVGHNIRDFMSPENARHFQQSFEVSCTKRRAVTIQALPGVPSNLRVYGFYISPIMGAPIMGSDGDITYLDVIGQLDVSDQSILQRERDDAISLMSSIFDVSEVGVVVTDHNTRIIRVNESFVRTYGWSRDELINSDVITLVTPDERNLARRNHDEFIRTGIRSSGEMKIIRKDGNIANALFTTATLELSQKRRYQVTTVMDITLRKQMEESLRLAKDQADTANRAKSAFLANMSHELRTPLNAIIGFSEMMIKETFGALGHDKYKEYLGDVHASANHLLEIINEVLDMSKIEAGRIELDESGVDIGETVSSVTRMMASKAFGSSLKINIDVPADLPGINADQRLVRQIFINLLSNAVKFSRPGGNIDVHAEMLKDGRLQVDIRDEGVGIPTAKINQAMEPFGQVSDRAENAQYQQGTGLGLPLAKAMIELHDGKMKLESEEGKGTRVTIIFPAYRVMVPETAQPAILKAN
ncbi:MAG: PAS domain S-box protein [Alphaproteobacteria bacterium]|jgi:two-component system cell cycle sensor histidine kinase PleC|nr:PAS domain S-box protein [Alphaproteobacteria bacterium]